MKRNFTDNRLSAAAFLVLYLCVTQSHAYQHLNHSAAAGQSGDASVTSSAELVSKPIHAGVDNWYSIVQLDSPCAAESSSESHDQHACHCTISLFTVQQKVSSRLNLASRDIDIQPLKTIRTQFYPRGVNPPPKFS